MLARNRTAHASRATFLGVDGRPDTGRAERAGVFAQAHAKSLESAQESFVGVERMLIDDEAVDVDVFVIGLGEFGVVVARPLAALTNAELGVLHTFESQVKELLSELSQRRLMGGTPRGGSVEAIAALSAREREVLDAFRAVGSVAVVSQTLHLSPHTVRSHLKAIYRKLGVSSQAELLSALMQ